MGEEDENRKKIVGEMVLNGNGGGVVVVGLGCEKKEGDVLGEFVGGYEEEGMGLMVGEKVEDE